MNPLLHYALLLLLPSIVLIHLICSPYTKVEESFNIQAIHDIVTYGISFSNAPEHLQKHYDHIEFPGAVPRTFVGALSIAGVAWPFMGWLSKPEHAQILVRGVVGAANCFALLAFQNAVSQSFGRVAGYWYILFQSTQFHIMYYASRTLPNMYAFCLCTVAQRLLMLSHFGARQRRSQRIALALGLLTIAGITFRAEIALLLACETSWLLLVRKVSLRRVILPAGIAAMTVGLFITVSVDSFFWQQFPIWPEWVAFRYNTIEGKSSDWGTSPWHFYFVNAIPRLMMNPATYLLCIPIALADRLTRRFSLETITPLLAFVGIYSILPHKEWRFIIYIIPGLTAVSSAGAAYTSNRRSKHWFFTLLSIGLITATIFSFIASAGQLYISTLNYPGAEALQRLHTMAYGERPFIRVHLDNLACQTGVTRFLQKKMPAVSMAGWENQTVWYYDKTENESLKRTPEFWERFDYALVENPRQPIGRWESVETIQGYGGIRSRALQDQNDLERGGNSQHAKQKDPRMTSQHQDYPMEQTPRKWPSLEDWTEEASITPLEISMVPRIYILRKKDT